MSRAEMRFLVPASDPGRAVRFYTNVFGYSIRAEAGDGTVTFSLGADSCAFVDPMPVSIRGIAACLPVEGSIPRLLDRIREAGGTVLVPGTMVSRESGYFGMFADPEGNRMALTSAT